VLDADYQSRIHVFRDGVYDRRHSLPTSTPALWNGRPHRAATGTSPFDYSSVSTGIRSIAQIAARSSCRTPAARSLSSSPRRPALAEVGDANEGMTRPAIIGDDLADGVLLVARDAGEASGDGIFLRMGDGLRPRTASR